jgi:aminocarboxymuconate-semialdehyde decarboxylase
MGIVDCHAHVFPNTPLRSHSAAPWPRLEIDTPMTGRLMIGDRVFREVGAELWDVEARLAALDRHGVDLQIVSPVPVTLDVRADTAGVASYLRGMNDGIASMVAKAPDRLVGLGAVPLHDPAGDSVGELNRLIGELGLAGVEIGARAGDRELDDPQLRPFFRTAERLGALIFVHPLGGGAGALRRTGQPYDFGLGMLTDTALAATALLFGGVLDDCPNLKILLAHGGGTFPWAFTRLTRAASLGGDASSGNHTALIRRFWVDTMVFEPDHLEMLVSRFGADRVLYGSDHPFIPGQLEGAREFIDAGVARGALIAEDAVGVLGDNALELLRGVAPSRFEGG